MTRIAFQTAMRAAAVALLEGYKAEVEQTLQVYPARPRSLHPPTAFVDRIRERIDYSGHMVQRHPQADIVVLHAVFDSKEAVDQRDAFVDGFLDWAIDHFHAAGANTDVGIVSVEDDPAYLPDWIGPDAQNRTFQYYATLMTLEGLSLSG